MKIKSATLSVLVNRFSAGNSIYVDNIKYRQEIYGCLSLLQGGGGFDCLSSDIVIGRIHLIIVFDWLY